MNNGKSDRTVSELPPQSRMRQPSAIYNLAYGSSSGVVDTPYTYRIERGFPFNRAGQTVTVASQFQTLGGTQGSAIGLHQPVSQSALTGNKLDPSKTGFLQQGSNVPTFITVPFTFNAGSPTTLTISWPAYPLRRGNRQPWLNISSDTQIPAGSIAITTLVANTQYFFYPYWSEAQKSVGWGGAGNATSAGTPAIAQTVQSDTVLQSQSYQGFVPINTLAFTTPNAGTKTVTGGYTAAGVPDTVTGGGRSYRIL